MHPIVMALMLASGGCLAVIGIRHLGWAPRSLLEQEVQRELMRPLDRTDRILAIGAVCSFVLFLGALALLGA